MLPNSETGIEERRTLCAACLPFSHITPCGIHLSTHPEVYTSLHTLRYTLLSHPGYTLLSHPGYTPFLTPWVYTFPHTLGTPPLSTPWVHLPYQHPGYTPPYIHPGYTPPYIHPGYTSLLHTPGYTSLLHTPGYTSWLYLLIHFWVYPGLYLPYTPWVYTTMYMPPYYPFVGNPPCICLPTTRFTVGQHCRHATRCTYGRKGGIMRHGEASFLQLFPFHCWARKEALLLPFHCWGRKEASLKG